MLPDKPYEIINKVPMTTWKGPNNCNLTLVNTEEEWDAFYELLMQQEVVACDTETTGLRYYQGARVCGLSFGWKDQHFYIPVRHEASLLGGDPPPQLTLDHIKEDIQDFFNQKEVVTVWHNAKFDLHFYAADGIQVKCEIHDTMNMWKLFNENAPAALKSITTGWRDYAGRWIKGLVGPSANKAEKDLSRWRSEEAKARRQAYSALVMQKADELQTELEYQGWKRLDLKRHIKQELLADHPYANTKKDDIHYGVVPVPLMAEYAALDTYLTWQVFKYVLPQLYADDKLWNLYQTERDLLLDLFETEQNGVKMNRRYLEELDRQYGDQLEKIEAELREILEAPNLNLNSADQLVALMEPRGVVFTKKTDSGKWSLDAEVLDQLASLEEGTPGQHEASLLLKHRNFSKLRSTYVQGILDKLTDDDILHCSYNQMVTTGRMSCGTPNLQNIPAGNIDIRKAFVTLNEDYIYLFVDYSQIELRLTAHFSQDPIMLDAYSKNQDLHTRALCEMFGYDYDVAVVAKDDKAHSLHKEIKFLRTIAKRINFGIIYGVGAPGLARQTGKSIEECKEFIDLYLRTYVGVKRMMNAGKRMVAAEGFVQNTFGRKRRLPHIHANKVIPKTHKHASKEHIDMLVRVMQGRAKRQAVNFLIQGEAADLFKTAVVRVNDLLRTEAKYSRTVNYVHDEIQIYLHKSELHLLKKIKDRMEDFEYSVPIIADFEWSTSSWGEKKTLHV